VMYMLKVRWFWFVWLASACVVLGLAGRSGLRAVPQALSCPCSLWGDSVTPSMGDAGADNSVELGVTFRADVDGTITALRFYKSAANVGPHVGTLWTSSGTALAQVTFANETALGWQQAALPSPVSIVAGTTYVASYHTNTGHYAFGAGTFATSGVD